MAIVREQNLVAKLGSVIAASMTSFEPARNLRVLRLIIRPLGCPLHDPVYRASGDLKELRDFAGGVLSSLI